MLPLSAPPQKLAPDPFNEAAEQIGVRAAIGASEGPQRAASAETGEKEEIPMLPDPTSPAPTSPEKFLPQTPPQNAPTSPQPTTPVEIVSVFFPGHEFDIVPCDPASLPKEEQDDCKEEAESTIKPPTEPFPRGGRFKEEKEVDEDQELQQDVARAVADAEEKMKKLDQHRKTAAEKIAAKEKSEENGGTSNKAEEEACVLGVIYIDILLLN